MNDWRTAMPLTVVILMLGSLAPMLSGNKKTPDISGVYAIHPSALTGFEGGGDVVAGLLVNFGLGGLTN